MECEKCGGIMFIDEWNGWVWTCVHCDYISRHATDEEIEEQEKGE